MSDNNQDNKFTQGLGIGLAAGAAVTAASILGYQYLTKKPEPKGPEEPRYLFISHAGFGFEWRGVKILFDPWFFAGFIHSSFPYPDPMHILDDILETKWDYLYVSHLHEDHWDEVFLKKLPRDIKIICPDYTSKLQEKEYKNLGFTNVFPLGHQKSKELAPGLTATMILDVGYLEDSGLLIQAGNHRFLHLNDCNSKLDDLPTNIDVLTCQFAGAHYYPHCYTYDEKTMTEKVTAIKKQLFETIVKKINTTGAKHYIPSAGPICYLDPKIMYNDLKDGNHIFTPFSSVVGRLQEACPNTTMLYMNPGDVADTFKGKLIVTPYAGPVPDQSLEQYSKRRQMEWQKVYTTKHDPVTVEMVSKYIETIQKDNPKLVKLGGFSKHFVFKTETEKTFYVIIGKGGPFVSGERPAEDKFREELTFELPEYILWFLVSGKTHFEHMLFSDYCKITRNPDYYDMHFYGLMRYGHNPTQTDRITEMRSNNEMTSHEALPGVRYQKYCPHNGEDLGNAIIANNIIECPRHHWQWDAASGKCLSGTGNVDLKIEVIDW